MGKSKILNLNETYSLDYDEYKEIGIHKITINDPYNTDREILILLHVEYQEGYGNESYPEGYRTQWYETIYNNKKRLYKRNFYVSPYYYDPDKGYTNFDDWEVTEYAGIDDIVQYPNTKITIPADTDTIKYLISKVWSNQNSKGYFNNRYLYERVYDGVVNTYKVIIVDLYKNIRYESLEYKIQFFPEVEDIIYEETPEVIELSNLVQKIDSFSFTYTSLSVVKEITLTGWKTGKTYLLSIPVILGQKNSEKTLSILSYKSDGSYIPLASTTDVTNINVQFLVPSDTAELKLVIYSTSDTGTVTGSVLVGTITLLEGTEKEYFLNEKIKLTPKHLKDLDTKKKSYVVNLLGTEWLRFAKLTDKDIFGSGIVTINCYGELDNSQTPLTSSMFGVNVGYDSAGELFAKIEPISQSKTEADTESDGNGSGAMGSDGGSGDNAFYGLSNVRFSEDEDSIYLEGLFSAPTVQDAYNNIIVEIIIDNNSNIENLNELEISYTSNGDNVLVDGGLLYEKEYIAKITFNNSELGEYINKLKETSLQDDILLTVNRGEHLPTLNIHALYQNQDNDESIYMPVFGQGNYRFHYIYNTEGLRSHLNVIEINTQSTRTGIIDIDLFKEIDIKFENYLPVKVDSITFKTQDDLGHLMLKVYTSPVDLYTLDVEYYVNNELVTMPFEVKRFDKLSIKYTIPDSIIPYASNGMYKIELFTEFWTEDLVVSIQNPINLKGQLAMLNTHTLEWHDPDFPGTIELVEAVPKTEATALTSISGFEKLLENYVKKDEIHKKYEHNIYLYISKYEEETGDESNFEIGFTILNRLNTPIENFNDLLCNLLEKGIDDEKYLKASGMSYYSLDQEYGFNVRGMLADIDTIGVLFYSPANQDSRSYWFEDPDTNSYITFEITDVVNEV